MPDAIVGEVVHVEQAVFGYDGGHRMLASSAVLEPEIESLIARLSDDTGAVGVPGFNGYLTGYQASEKFYVLSRTWSAPEIRRPGAVWTHALLIPQGMLSRPDWDFTPLFRKPNSKADLESYRSSLPLGRVKRQVALRVTQLSTDSWASAFSGFVANPGLTAWMAVPDPAEAEEVFLWFWSWLWPAARRKFSFCSGASGPRRGPWGQFHMVAVPRALERGARADLPLLPQESSQAGKAIALDLNGASPTRMGSFCRFAGAESASFQALRVLLSVWLEASGISGGTAIGQFEKAADEVASSYPRLHTMRRLKRLILQPDSHLPARWTAPDIARRLQDHPIAKCTAAADVDLGLILKSLDGDKVTLLRLAMRRHDEDISEDSVLGAMTVYADQNVGELSHPDWLDAMVREAPDLATRTLRAAEPPARPDWIAAYGALSEPARGRLLSQLAPEEELTWLAAFGDEQARTWLAAAVKEHGVLAFQPFAASLTADQQLASKWVGHFPSETARLLLRAPGALSDADLARVLSMVDPDDAGISGMGLAPWLELDATSLDGAGAAHLLRLAPHQNLSKVELGAIGRAFGVAWERLAQADLTTWDRLGPMPVDLGAGDNWDHARRLSAAIAASVGRWSSAQPVAASAVVSGAMSTSPAAARQLIRELKRTAPPRSTKPKPKPKPKQKPKKRKKGLLEQARDITVDVITLPWR